MEMSFVYFHNTISALDYFARLFFFIFMPTANKSN